MPRAYAFPLYEKESGWTIYFAELHIEKLIHNKFSKRLSHLPLFSRKRRRTARSCPENFASKTQPFNSLFSFGILIIPIMLSPSECATFIFLQSFLITLQAKKKKKRFAEQHCIALIIIYNAHKCHTIYIYVFVFFDWQGSLIFLSLVLCRFSSGLCVS